MSDLTRERIAWAFVILDLLGVTLILCLTESRPDAEVWQWGAVAGSIVLGILILICIGPRNERKVN